VNTQLHTLREETPRPTTRRRTLALLIHQNVKTSWLELQKRFLFVGCSLWAAVGMAETLYVSNFGDSTISKVSSDGVVTVWASVPTAPYGLAFDGSGDLFVAIAQMTNKVCRITPSGVLNTFARLANYYDATGTAFDSSGRLYVASQNGGGISRITSLGAVTTFTKAVAQPFGLAFDSRGDLYAADFAANAIRKIAPDGTASTFTTKVAAPWGLAFDSRGVLHAASLASGAISQIAPDGTVTTFVSGQSVPGGLAFDSGGNLYVANQTLGTISRITPNRAVSTFARGLSQPTFIAVEPALDPPRLSLPFQSAADIARSGLRLVLSGGITLYYRTEYSTDLGNWAPLQTVQVRASTEVEMVDSDAANSSPRFYRGRLLP